MDRMEGSGAGVRGPRRGFSAEFNGLLLQPYKGISSEDLSCTNMCRDVVSGREGATEGGTARRRKEGGTEGARAGECKGYSISHAFVWNPRIMKPPLYNWRWQEG